MPWRSAEPTIAAAGLVWLTTSSVGPDARGPHESSAGVPPVVSLVCELVPGKTFRIEYVKEKRKLKFSEGPSLYVDSAVIRDGELLIFASSPVYSLTARVGETASVSFREAGAKHQHAECVVERPVSGALVRAQPPQ